MSRKNLKDFNIPNLNRYLEKTIASSQHCQRNWDLSKDIPEEDIKTMQAATTQCGSKQNRVFFKTIFIQNRDLIERIYDQTTTHYTSEKYKELPKNDPNSYMQPQVLGNLLVAFVRDRDPSQGFRTPEERIHGRSKYGNEADRDDENIALGIAAGYLTLTANMLGYKTGCCQCMNQNAVKEILGEDQDPLLLMGIGFKDEDRNRLEHHLKPGKMFKSLSKEVITEEIR